MFHRFIPDIYSLWGQRPFPLILLPELPVHFCPYYVTTFSLRCNSYLSGSHYRFHSLHTFSAPCSVLMSAAFARSMNLRAYFCSFPLSLFLCLFSCIINIFFFPFPFDTQVKNIKLITTWSFRKCLFGAMTHDIRAGLQPWTLFTD